MAAAGERIAMSIEGWIQRWKVAQVFYDWQTLIAGVLALLAGFGTVAATMIIARRQINAAREEADSVIAATRAQTEVTVKQTETTVRLARKRNESEARRISRHARSGDDARPRRGGLGQKDLSEPF